MNEISRSNVFSLLSGNQRLLERLEAENAQLRGTVAELMLEIQALREALGHPHLKSDPEKRRPPYPRRGPTGLHRTQFWKKNQRCSAIAGCR